MPMISYNTLRITNAVALIIAGFYILGFFRNLLDAKILGSFAAAIGLGIYIFVIAHRIWVNR